MNSFLNLPIFYHISGFTFVGVCGVASTVFCSPVICINYIHGIICIKIDDKLESFQSIYELNIAEVLIEWFGVWK